MISWLTKLDKNGYDLELPADSHGWGVIVIERKLYCLIDEYAFSVPTAPSPGRIYRREYADGHRFVFVVVDEPGGTGYQLHVPCEVIHP